MSASRADRLERLQRLLERRRELEEWRLADLKRRETALAAEAQAMLVSLGDQSLLHGLFLEAKAAGLRRKEAERAAVGREAKAADARLSEAARAERRVMRAGAEARRAENVEEEARSLVDVLDAHLMAGPASAR